MKIVDYDSKMNKDEIVDMAFSVCKGANFPVEYDDVYNHLFYSDILKLLIDDKRLVGFGVFIKYKMEIKERICSMLYLSGMVIDKNYQGNNISHEILRRTYNEVKSDLVGLRTQNIKMAKALLSLYKDYLFRMPGEINYDILNFLRIIEPYRDIDDKGIIRDCYDNQLFDKLDITNREFKTDIGINDALGVIVEPMQKQKKKSIFD